jgi:cysteine synthase A
MQQRLLALSSKVNSISSTLINSGTQLVKHGLSIRPQRMLTNPIQSNTLHSAARNHYNPRPNTHVTTHAITQALRKTTPQKPILNAWQKAAIETLLAEQKHCPETPIYLLFKIDGVNVYAKDERQFTGSHKHRLARSLLLHALRNGLIDSNTRLIDASSGGTACSEAYFAKLLHLPYTAVVARNTPKKNLDAITAHLGNIVECEPGQDKTLAEKLGKEPGWYFIDHFTNASIATDKEKNIASELTAQFQKMNTPMPRYVVCGIGTGGTSTILGNYFQQHGFDKTEVIAGDPENSAFYPAFQTHDRNIATGIFSRIGGIGRPTVEPAFDPTKIADMIAVPDAASIAGCHFLQHVSGLHTGGSTGTNVYTCFELIERMRQRGEKGSILMFLFDHGKLYENTYYNPEWLRKQKINIEPYLHNLMNVYGNFSDNSSLSKTEPLSSSAPARFHPCPTERPRLFNAKLASSETKQEEILPVMIDCDTTFKP